MIYDRLGGAAKNMKDMIDERNERERIRKSIIKYWNVNYVPVAADENTHETCGEEQGEYAGDRTSEQEERFDEAYNRTTKTYSGKYGRSDIEDEVTRGQIEQILQEKTNAIRSLFEHSGE